MGVHWTVLYILHGTEGRDRQWVGFEVKARNVWASIGLSYYALWMG